MSPQPNNAMQPTANQLGCHRELGARAVVYAAADGGRSASSFIVVMRDVE